MHSWDSEFAWVRCIGRLRFCKKHLTVTTDINPHEFSAPFEAFELGTFFEEQKVDIVAMSCAWCTVAEDPDLGHERAHETVSVRYSLQASPSTFADLCSTG